MEQHPSPCLLLDAVPLINCGMNRVIPFATMHHQLKAQNKSQERPAILIRKAVFKDNMDGCCFPHNYMPHVGE
jgi:hypothetical protein